MPKLRQHLRQLKIRRASEALQEAGPALSSIELVLPSLSSVQAGTQGSRIRGPAIGPLLLSLAAVGVCASRGGVHNLSPAGQTCSVATRLLLGSADPHGLGLEERQAPCRRRSTFHSMAHVSADIDELLGRPFVDFNVAPVTCARALPEAPVEGAPLFTRIEQIIPLSTLQLVNHWRRRLRRCFKFAYAGNYRMAKRLRPPDLWLSADVHMTPEARPWDWDLCPLSRGEPAVPWAVSGRGGLRPSTALDLETVARGAEGFVDLEIVGEMLSGIEDDAACARGTLLCAPHTSALRNLRLASEKLDKSLDGGWGFVEDLPAWPVRACPYGMVDESERAGKVKWRLTNDLSWPHPGVMTDGDGGFVDSLNASMDRQRWPEGKLARIADFAEAAAVMRASGAPVRLWSLDCEAFYKQMGRQNAQIWRVAMMRETGIQVDTRCCFGSAADAAKCSRVSNFLAFHARKAMALVDAAFPSVNPAVVQWESRRRQAAEEAGEPSKRFTSLGRVAIYIDDALGVSFDDVLVGPDGVGVWRNGQPLTRAVAHFEAAKAAIESFGFVSAPLKEQSPRTRAVMLGVELDVDEGWMRLDPVKRKAYLGRVRQALNTKSMPRSDFLRLLGRLQFAAMCLPKARQWLHAPWRAARVRFRTAADSVLLTKAVVADFRRWEAALSCEDQPQVPLASTRCVGVVGEEGVGAMYADASGSIGWAAWTVVGNEVLLIDRPWSPDEQELDISVKELYASTAGLASFAAIARWKGVYNYTDSMVALATMRYATPSVARLQALSAARVDLLLQLGVREGAERIGSRSNLWADLGSRGRGDEVVRQAAALGRSTRRVAVAPEWESAAWLAELPVG